MKEKKPLYYGTVLLVALLMFFSNFLSTGLFESGTASFTTWFVLSVFVFTCGWLINKTFGWEYGGKILFAVVIATTFLSLVLISVFSGYFGMNDPVAENMLLYSLRNVYLGAIGFFGMAASEVMLLQREMSDLTARNDAFEKDLEISKRETEVKIKEAGLKAEKIVNEAERKSAEMNDKREKIKSQLKEFILAERELIRKYESDN